MEQNTSSKAKQSPSITQEMIDSAQTLTELRAYRDKILAYREKTLERFNQYDKLSVGQQKFLKYLKRLRHQCLRRISRMEEELCREKTITRNERIIACSFVHCAKQELSKEQYERIYGRALERVGKRLQSEPPLIQTDDIEIDFEYDPTTIQ